MNQTINRMIEENDLTDLIKPFKVEMEGLSESSLDHRQAWVITHANLVLAALKDLQAANDWTTEKVWRALSKLTLEVTANLAKNPQVAAPTRSELSYHLNQIPGYDSDRLPSVQHVEADRAYAFAISTLQRAVNSAKGL